MSAVLVHDVVTLGFLLPFACMCLAEVAFNYTVYPLFITHALIFHMAFDLAWMFIQPTIIPNLRGFIGTPFCRTQSSSTPHRQTRRIAARSLFGSH